MKQNKGSGIFANWKEKIICFTFAVITVFLVYYSGQQKRTITLPLNVILPENYIAASNIPDSANLVIKGSEKQIYMFNPENFSLSADFSEVNQEGVASVLVNVKVVNYREDLNLDEITFFSEPSQVKIYFEAK